MATPASQSLLFAAVLLCGSCGVQAPQSAADAPTADTAPSDAVLLDDTAADVAADVTAAVVPPSSAALCSPCHTAQDCVAIAATVTATCDTDPAVTTGSFCSFACDDDTGCPDNYVCTGAAGHCIPASGACVCTPWSFYHAGTCTRTNANGTCTDGSMCIQVGDSPYCAPGVAAMEICNGKDDDCDGLTDEGDTCPSMACIVGVCDSAAGECVYTPLSDTPCKGFYYGPCDAHVCKSGQCVGSSTTCDDGSACTDDTCDYKVGCVFTPIVCPPDYNSCTLDTCDSSKGCVHIVTPTGPCDDGNPCTVGDQCLGDVCMPGTVTGTCDDLNACSTDDHCVGTACVASVFVTCDDGLSCTTDACFASYGCVHSVSPACDDGNSCTADGCGPAGACTHVNVTGACALATACVTGSVCGNGVCGGGTPINCDDGEPCTIDSCDLGDSCQHVALPSGTTCTDTCGQASACGPAGCSNVSPIGLHIFDAPGAPTGIAADVTMLADGYALVGDGWALRTDLNGKVKWQQNGGYLAGHDMAAVAGTPDGLIVAGRNMVATELLKLDTSGKVVWAVNLDNGVDGSLSDVVAVTGGYVVAGITAIGSSTGSKGTLTRVDASGAVLWAQQFDPLGNGGFARVASLADGFVLAGWSAEMLWLLRTDQNGKLLWQQLYGESSSPAVIDLSARSLVVLPDGFVIAGLDDQTSYDCYPCYYAPRVMRTDLSGNLLWKSDLDQASYGNGDALLPVGDGFLVQSGANLVRIDGYGDRHGIRPVSNRADFTPSAFASNGTRIAVAGHLATGNYLALDIGDAWDNDTCATSGTCEKLSGGACDDGQPHTFDACDAAHGGCWHDGPVSLADCPTDSSSPCEVTSFSIKAGCTAVPSPKGSPCADACGGLGVCDGTSSSCTGVAPVTCDDGDPCTVDACSNLSGCLHTQVAALCNDGNPCTSEGCDGKGTCTHTSLPDGASCGDTCGNVCLGGTCAFTHKLGYVWEPQFSVGDLFLVLPTGVVSVTQYGDDASLGRWDPVGKLLVPTIPPWLPWPSVKLNPVALAQVPDGYAVVGQDMTLARFDELGNVQLDVKLQVEPTASAMQMWGTPKGIVLAGYVGTVDWTTWTGMHPWLALVDEAGGVQWQVTVAKQMLPYIAVQLGSGFAFLGQDPDKKPVALATDALGQVLWTWTGPKPEQGQAVTGAALPDGLLLLHADAKTSVDPVWLVRLDLAGNVLWQRTLDAGQDNPQIALGTQIVALPDGGFINRYWPTARYDAWGNFLLSTKANLSAGDCLPRADGLTCTAGIFFLSDAWLHTTCEESGPCLGKGWSDCSDGDPCTADRCDAAHGGCWHVALAAGSPCGIGKVCGAGVCK